MARSGSVDFSLNRNEIIKSAYELVGEATEGEPLEAEDTAVASRALNMMVKAWMGYGLQLWKRDKLTVTAVSAQASYTIGRSGSPDLTADRPLRVLEANRVGNGTVDTSRVELIRITRNEYEELSDLTTTGVPSQYFFDPTLDNSTLYLWPVPDATFATNVGIELVVQSPLEDFDTGTDDADFPVEWLEAIVYGLAVRLAPRSSLPLQERYLLRAEFKEALKLAKDFNVEDGSIYLQPNNEGDFGGY